MIRRLRARHLAMITVLSIVVAILFIAAIAVRRPIPANHALPEPLLKSSGGKR